MNMCSRVSNTFSNINDSMHWKSLNYSNAKKESDVPEDALIAPSRNLLQPEVYHARESIDISSIDIPTIAKQNGLQELTHYKIVPMTNHCVSMSLNFIKNYVISTNIVQAADAMKDGADEDCARCSMAYEALQQANMYSEKGEEVLLDQLRNSAANIFGLSLEKEFILNMPLPEMLHYLKNKLVTGEYLIRLPGHPGHVVTLIKNEKGLFLYDANQGTVDLTKAGELWFFRFLEKYKINFTECLNVIKVQNRTLDTQIKPYEKNEIVSEHELPPQLKYSSLESLSDRWQIAEFFFRDKTYCFVKDMNTGLIYNDNSQKMVRNKFCLLTPRNMVDTTARTVYHVARTAINLLKLPFSLVHGRKKAFESISKIKRSACDIIRAPVFGIMGTCVAFYGIFKPYEGRRLYGFLERSLNRQNERVDWFSKYYVAPCFVPLNFNVEVEDLNNEKKTMEILKKYVIKSQSFNKRFMFDLFCGWTRAFRCKSPKN